MRTLKNRTPTIQSGFEASLLQFFGARSLVSGQHPVEQLGDVAAAIVRDGIQAADKRRVYRQNDQPAVSFFSPGTRSGTAPAVDSISCFHDELLDQFTLECAAVLYEVDDPFANEITEPAL